MSRRGYSQFYAEGEDAAAHKTRVKISKAEEKMRESMQKSTAKRLEREEKEMRKQVQKEIKENEKLFKKMQKEQEAASAAPPQSLYKRVQKTFNFRRFQHGPPLL